MKCSLERKIAYYTLIQIPVTVLINILLTKEIFWDFILSTIIFIVVPSVLLARWYVSFRKALVWLGVSAVVFAASYAAIKQMYFLTMWSMQSFFILGIAVSVPAGLIMQNYLSGWQEMTGMSTWPRKKEKYSPLYFEKTKKYSIGLVTSWIILVFSTLTYCYQFQVNDFSVFISKINSQISFIPLIPVHLSITAFLLMLIITTLSFVLNITTAIKNNKI